MFIIFKIIITAILIVAITEIAKLNDRIGGLIAALPITTFIILFWLNYENNTVEKISNQPYLSYKFEYDCIECGTKNERELKGLQDFFG